MQSIAHHYKLLHIDQEKCETLNRVARGTVMHGKPAGSGGAASPSLDEDCRDCLEIIIVAAVFMLFIGVQVAILKRRRRHSRENVRSKKG